MYDSRGSVRNSALLPCSFQTNTGIGTTSAGTPSHTGAVIVRTKNDPDGSGESLPARNRVRSSFMDAGHSAGSRNRVA